MIIRFKTLEQEHFIPKFTENTERKLRKFTYMSFVAFTMMGIFYVTFPMLNSTSCEAQRKTSVHMKLPCGLVTPIWTPFDLHNSQIFFLHEIYTYYLTMFFTTLIAQTIVFQCGCIFHIVDHIKELKMVLKTAVNSGDRGHFIKAVKYHYAIIS